MKRWRSWAARLGVLLWLPLLARGQGPQGPAALNRPVHLAPGRRPLGALLAELSRQSRLPFSYSSSLVPVAHLCYLPPGPARPAGAVLRDVLAAEHLSYGLLNGQLVLWPSRAAAPVGVAGVNGQGLLPAPPAGSPATAAHLNDNEVFNKSAASTARQLIKAAASPSAGLAGQATLSAKRPVASAAKPARQTEATHQNRTTAPRYVARKAPQPGPATTKQPPPRALAQTAGAGRLRRRSRAAPVAAPAAGIAPTSRQLTRAGRAGTSGSASQAEALMAAGAPTAARRAVHPTPRLSYPGQARLAGSARPAHPGRGPVDTLAYRRTEPALALGAIGARLPPALVPVDLMGAAWALANSRLRTDSLRRPASALGVPAQRFYLHGEAGGGETLPLSAAVEVGWPRVYLVLGAAAAPTDHRGGWAWGGGLGTVGRARGRFTPSLDLLHWVVTGDGRGDDSGQGQLTQLRPALAWQLKQGGRWQLVGGPTFNLATASRGDRGSQTPGPRWTLGQHQWLWLDTSGERPGVRLWPGVQVGLRF